MARLDTDHGPVVDLIARDRVYVVPPYQRPYSWRAQREVAELWGDVVRLHRERLGGARDATHFIGSVVIGQASTKALGPTDAPIIDGQQRLITLSLLIAAIRDELVVDEDDRQDITRQYLAHTKGEAIKSVRLSPGEVDRKVFEQIILGKTVIATRSKVFKAYEHFRRELRAAAGGAASGDEADLDGDDVLDVEQEEVADLDEEPLVVEWNELLETIGSHLELVSISGVAPENAYQIFATLNHRGLELSQVDLIRNAIFMLLPTRGASAHASLWRPLESALSESLENYFHAWVIRRGHNVPKKDTYRSVVQELSRAGTRERNIENILKSAHDEAWVYLVVTRPNSDVERKIFSTKAVPAKLLRQLARLRSWGTIPLEPALLEIVGRWHEGRLTLSAAVRLCELLESLVVRRFICQVPPNDLRSTFARLVQQVIGVPDAEFAKRVVQAMLEPARRWPTDDEVTDAFITRPAYRTPGHRQSFYVLKRLAEGLEGKECPHVTLGTGASDFTIEHILPQTMTPTWEQALKDWGDVDPVETWETRRHTIGNLTLTAYNSELSNKPFADKKQWIRTHLRLMLSKQVLASNEWTRDSIEARGRSLAKTAASVWARPSAG
ncbi:MAG TPA: DUF262 domain-containing protein [Mycobacteriales bacterium]